MNIGLAEARNDLIVRADAHTLYAPDYVRRSRRGARRDGADWVGARCGRWAPTLRSGGGRGDLLAVRHRPRPVPLRRRGRRRSRPSTWARPTAASSLEVGGYDEDDLQWAAEDQELNYRLRRAGRPHLARSRRSAPRTSPAQTPRSLWRQYVNYGMCKASTLKKHRTLPYWRPLAPAVMVAGSAAWAVVALARRRRCRGPRPGRGLRRRRRGASRVRLGDEPGVAPHRAFGALAICHWGYGLGFWRGRRAASCRGRPFDVPPEGPPLMPAPRSRERLGEYASRVRTLALRERRPGAGAAPRPTPAAGATRSVAGRRPRVLFLSPRDWAVHVQWEAVIAQALRAAGCRRRASSPAAAASRSATGPTLEAPPMPCRSCTRYVDTTVDAHGFPRRSTRAGLGGDDPGAWPEIDELSLDELVDVGRRWLPLGRLVEIPVKWFLMRGRPRRRPARRGLDLPRASCGRRRRIARGVEAALDTRCRPTWSLLLNGLFLFEAIAWASAAPGHRRRDLRAGFIKETLVFAARRPACLYDVGDDWPRSRDVPLTGRASTPTRRPTCATGEHGRRTIDRFWGGARFDDARRVERRAAWSPCSPTSPGTPP